MTVDAAHANDLDQVPNKVQIDVCDLGPIANASVQLKPLTIFVGPSNTGKTYLAILTYVLHRCLTGFRLLPVPHRSLLHPYDILETERRTPSGVCRDPGVSAAEMTDLIAKCRTQDRPFMYSDLSESVRDTVRSVLRNPELLGRDIEVELRRCFDSPTIGDLIRMSGHTDEARIKVRVGDDTDDYWHFGVKISEPNISVSGGIEDMILIPKQENRGFYPVMKLDDQSGRTPSPYS